MKRIVSIQDISCVGRCSLTVALPIISAMGVECAIVPTAVLSTHTAFKGFTFDDLTDQIEPISKHWQEEGIAFDAIYTGYLGSFEQLNLVSDFFDAHRGENTLVFVDPAMGDYGKLYPGFTEEFAVAMGKKVCAKADIIVPNMTEASFMLEIPFVEDGEYTEEYVQDVLKKLCGLGAKKAVLTGVCLEPGKCGVYGFDSQTGEYFSYFNDYVDAKYHGTGDVFSSTAVGALMNEKPLAEALAIAADYTVASIKTTVEDPQSEWYGVEFEAEIPYLLKRLGK
jgi:pyridoxine kinase